jgi:hypothetical protein
MLLDHGRTQPQHFRATDEDTMLSVLPALLAAGILASTPVLADPELPSALRSVPAHEIPARVLAQRQQLGLTEAQVQAIRQVSNELALELRLRRISSKRWLHDARFTTPEEAYRVTALMTPTQATELPGALAADG